MIVIGVFNLNFDPVAKKDSLDTIDMMDEGP